MKKYFRSRLSTSGTLLISVSFDAMLAVFGCGRKPATVSPSDSSDDMSVQLPSMNVKLQLVASGLQAPLYVAFPDSDDMLTVEQTGVIKLFKNGTASSTPFLDIRSKLVKLSGDYDERGLLGLAL